MLRAAKMKMKLKEKYFEVIRLETKRRQYNWLVWTVLVLILLAVTIDMATTVRLSRTLTDTCQQSRPSLPCAAIPRQFIADDPICADKLLRSMNVTNVRILQRGLAVLGSG